MTKPEKGDLLRGTLEMLILRTLTEGAMHGYAITEAIERVSKDVLKVGEGSMYPALYRMEKRGWIESYKARSDNNRIAKFYQLTGKGRRHLKGVWRRWRTSAAPSTPSWAEVRLCGRKSLEEERQDRFRFGFRDRRRNR